MRPAYAVPGDYWVGTQEFVIEDAERPLLTTIWYPALNPDNMVADVVYEAEAHWTPGPEFTLTFTGHALRDAAPGYVRRRPTHSLYYRTGFGANRVWYAYYAEHLASYGFVVVAPDHPELFNFMVENPYQDFPMATVERPRDVVRVIDYVAGLAEVNGELAGLVDTELVAVTGHSYGGFTSLAAAGARYDPDGFHQRCEADKAAGDPDAFNCDLLIPYEDDMLAMQGLENAPDDLWPYWGDERVDAIIPLAGDAYMFDQRGLAEVTVPVLAMGGTLDTGTPFEWGTHHTYQYVASPYKVMVAFDNAEHMMFTSSCDVAPWLIEIDFYTACMDPVWDVHRVHDLVNHFATAFLLDVFYEDEEAHAALMPENVAFPGITYEATMQ